MSTGSIIAELEEAVTNGGPEKRLDTLRRVTDLFLGESQRLSEEQVRVFDDVLIHLIQRIETKALVQLSNSIAPVDNAPLEVVRQLSRHDEIEVAGPVIRESNRLSEEDLIEIAQSKSQGHLLAMSERRTLQPKVTDVLIERGSREVHHTLAQNLGAAFSELGYASLVQKSHGDEALTESLGLRLDMPVPLLSHLLARANDRVRSRLLAAATPESQERIQQALASITIGVVRHAAGPRDFVAAESRVDALNRQGKLNETVLAEFVKLRNYEDMTATLALMCGVSSDLVERIMKHVNNEGVVMLCRAAKLGWPTLRLIIENRFAHHMVQQAELDAAQTAFMQLSVPVAQRSLRFMKMQETVKKMA